MWIALPFTHDYQPGDTLFLAEAVLTNSGITDYRVRFRPFITNGSHVVRLFGWCGETNNVSITAKAAVRLVKFNRERTKAMVVRLSKREAIDYAKKLGYLDGEKFPVDSE